MDAHFSAMDQALQTQPENYVVWQAYGAMQGSDALHQGWQAYAGWQPPLPGKAPTQEHDHD